MKKTITFLFIYFILAAGVKAQTSYSICAGSTIALQAPNPQNLMNPSYTMNPGNNGTSNGVYVVAPTTTTTFTLLTSGTNSLNATVTTTSNVIVNVSPKPNFNPVVVQAGCTNTMSSVNLNLTWNPASPIPAYSLSWTPLPATVTSAQQTTAGSLIPGPYTVIVTPPNSACTATTNFTVNPAPQQANYTVTPFGGTHSITCVQSSVVLTASAINSAPITYTWSGVNFTTQTGPSMTLSAANAGTVLLSGSNGTCSSSYTFNLVTNTTAPTSTLNPPLQNITCTQTNVTTVSVSATPTVNVTHHIYAPTGGIFTATSNTAIYTAGGPGTFTHVLVKDDNGCSVTKTFTIASTSGFPTYSVASPQNFSLGCTTKSIAVINIVNAATQPTVGGPVSYTILGPPTGTNVQSGALSINTAYTVNVPGTWTVIVHDNVNQCRTKTLVSIISNTFEPDISADVPNQTLTCVVPVTTLQGISETNNISYLWSFAGAPGTMPGQTIAVIANSIAPTQTLVNMYTLTITDNNNTCKSTSLIPIYQNLFKPNAAISATTTSLTCISPTVVLINGSNSGILPPFVHPLPPIGYLWEGPVPQQPLQVSTVYNAQTPGVYTLTVKDLNNGCVNTGTITISDSRVYPVVSASDPFLLPCPGTATIVAPIVNPQPSYTYSWNAPPGATTSIPNGYILTVNTAGFYTITVTNTVTNCSSQAVLAVYACVGISKNFTTDGITIYPNPNNGVFTIVSEGVEKTILLEIYNALGMLVRTAALDSGKNTLNLEAEVEGIYTLRILKDGKPISTTKIVKE